MILGIETALGGLWFGNRVSQGSFVLLSLDDAQEDLDSCFAMILKSRSFNPGELDLIRRSVRLISLRGLKNSIKFALSISYVPSQQER